jgi:hypothetical protein
MAKKKPLICKTICKIVLQLMTQDAKTAKRVLVGLGSNFWRMAMA